MIAAYFFTDFSIHCRGGQVDRPLSPRSKSLNYPFDPEALQVQKPA